MPRSNRLAWVGFMFVFAAIWSCGLGREGSGVAFAILALYFAVRSGQE